MTIGKVGLVIVPLYFYSFSLIITNPISFAWILIVPGLVVITLYYKQKEGKKEEIQEEKEERVS